MQEMPIHELMTRNVPQGSPGMALSEVIRLLHEQRLSCLVIVEDGTPVGIITERDLVRTLARVSAGEEVLHQTAADAMSAPPVTIPEEASLFEALVVARTRSIRHLPVVNKSGLFTGVISQTNLVAAHFTLIDRQTEALEESVKERTAALAEANERLMALSLTDTLMGIGNRRAMEVDLAHTLAEAERYQHPCAVALLDVDYFKRYNDEYGHQCGDEALQKIARYIEAEIREADRLYRYGGEELLLLMPTTDLEQASRVVERIVNGLAAEGIPHVQSPLGFLTISAGVAAMAGNMPVDAKTLVSTADECLYEAKGSGRNRMVAASPSAAA